MHGIFDYIHGGHLDAFDRVVVCSQSPRRRELLAYLKPICRSLDLDERTIEDRYMTLYRSDPFTHRVGKTACELAGAKCGLGDGPEEEGGALAGSLYIGADTMVVMDEKILHKPRDLEEAETMFRSYFGRTHHVVTGVCLRTISGFQSFYAVTAVSFVPYYPALEAAIREYLTHGRVLDKAGGYGIQDLDPRFVASIEGDIQTVIGLPLAEVARRIAPYSLDPEPEDFISLDDFTRMVQDLVEDLPPPFFEGLNGLVQIHPEVKYHPEALDDDLCIMGEYVRDKLGQRIKLYYGSFRTLYPGWSGPALKDRVNEVLIHEFRHHLEARAELRDLEVEDEAFLRDYRANHHYTIIRRPEN